MKIDWQATVETPRGKRTIRGSEAVPEGGGAVRIVSELPEGRIVSVSAVTVLAVGWDERIFMNGYQTWTYCPEYGIHDKIRGLNDVPRVLLDKFGFDRYGDYHFVKYPQRAGVTHGFSWCYFRRGETFRLIASLDERPGYTQFEYDSSTAILTLRRDASGVRCGGEYSLFDLWFAKGGEDEVFDGWFAAMGIEKAKARPLAGYSSWYNRYENIDEGSIRRDLEGCGRILRSGDLFQIDDGWEPAVGDWLAPDTEKFPRGLAPMVEEIHSAGYMAGLWLAPFVCCRGSKLYGEHPDWLLDVDGEPWLLGSNWGGFYSLDIDNPQVTEYLRETFRRVFDEWGFDLVKLDFLYGAAPFGNPRESRAGRMTRALEFIRQLCGDKLILGCGVPVMPAFGLVDYCRISCDVSLDWDDKWFMRRFHRERVSTRQALGNTIFRRELNGRAYISDPDVFFLRDDNLTLTESQKLLLGKVGALLGGVFLTSDDPSAYDEAKVELYRELRALREAENVRVDADRRVISYELDGERHELGLPSELF